MYLNPSHYTMWNVRKDALEVKGFKDLEVLKNEQKITVKCLMMNPKSYCVWEHRRWCIEQVLAEFGEKSEQVEKLVETEMALCEKFHSYDSRNFHCWNFRRWLIRLTEKTREKMREIDIKYSQKLIESNFSNYSAWHNRSKVFDVAKIKEEYDLLFNAIYTNPNDSSLWFYTYWLLSQTSDFSLVYTLAEHCVQLYLLDGEKESKWVILTILTLMKSHNFVENCKKHEKEVVSIDGKDERQLIEVLMSIDPMRKAYYQTFV